MACASVTAQRVELLGGTGALVPDAEWTVLGEKELTASERDSDPKVEPAHSLLLELIAGIRDSGHVEAHLVLHATGLAGRPRFVDSYCVPGDMTTAALRSDLFVETLRVGWMKRFAGPEVTMQFVSSATALPRGIGLQVRFAGRRADLAWTNDVYVIPAGSKLQWFVTTHLPEDEAAGAAIARLLGSFTGAREGHSEGSDWGSFASASWPNVVTFTLVVGMIVSWLVHRGRGPEPKRRRRRTP